MAKSVVMTPSAPTALVGVGDQRAELAVVGGDVGDRVEQRPLDRHRAGAQRREHRLDGRSSMPWHRSTALAPRDGQLDAALDDAVGQHDRGGGAVAGDLVGLHRHLAHHLGAHVLEAVEQLDLGGDRDAVAGDQRRADRAVDHRVHALGAERRLDRGGEALDAAGQRLARLVAVDQDLGHGFLRLFRETGLFLLDFGRFSRRTVAGGTRSSRKSTSVGSPSTCTTSL